MNCRYSPRCPCACSRLSAAFACAALRRSSRTGRGAREVEEGGRCHRSIQGRAAPGYDAAKAYPAIIALGGGPQTMNTVDGVLNRNLRAEAEKRGYIVVAPRRRTASCSSKAAPASSPSSSRRSWPTTRSRTAGSTSPGPRTAASRRSTSRRSTRSTSVGHRLSRLHVAADAGEAAGHLEDVCVLVRRRERRLHVARRDEARGRVPALEGDGGALPGREGPAAPHRDAGRRHAARLFDGFEETKKGCGR